MTALQLAEPTLTIVQILGLAAVVGPYLLQWRARISVDLRTILVGSIVQLISGLTLVGLSQATEMANPIWVVLRLLLSILVISAAFIAKDRQQRSHSKRSPDLLARVALHCAGACAIASIVMTVLWP